MIIIFYDVFREYLACECKIQTRLSTASKVQLDLFGFDSRNISTLTMTRIKLDFF